MVNVISNDTNTNLENLIQNDEYTIGIRGHGEGVIRKKGKFCVKDIKRVLFKRGEERDAIKLFVDVNRNVLISKIAFKQKNSFYPRALFKYYVEYLDNGKLLDNIPPMQKYAMKRSKRHTKNVKFCQYMRERCPELLKNPESILHDCDFLNKFYYNKIENKDEVNEFKNKSKIKK